ncbi:hypothetical protein GCM10022295_62740 [Streptomyces osmaniensis]|uniref:Uncharacterized protein n=1 Tax=Streptomyces osmaniensis TaxID=593134 RepID=A0ABP6XTV3_9ACTN
MWGHGDADNRADLGGRGGCGESDGVGDDVPVGQGERRHPALRGTLKEEAGQGSSVAGPIAQASPTGSPTSVVLPNTGTRASSLSSTRRPVPAGQGPTSGPRSRRAAGEGQRHRAKQKLLVKLGILTEADTSNFAKQQ